MPALPFERAHPLEVAPLLRRLQAHGPVHRVRTLVGDEAWMVTGYAEVRELLNDERLGMSHPDPDNAARANDSALLGGRPMDNYETEHADRAQWRSLLKPFFTPGRMRALRPRVEGLVTELLDAVEAQGSPADLHEMVSLPLPILVICELLGVPYEDRPKFRAYTQDAAVIGDMERSHEGLNNLWEYTRRLVAAKRADPGDDVISGLCAAEGGTLDDDDVAMMAAIILFAGHETTVVQIDYGAVLMLTNPGQRQAVADDPSLLGPAIEECLRTSYATGGGLPRYPRTDITVGGVTIRAGELVLLDNGAANHDEQVFADPHGFDVTRAESPHLTFGHGAHYCLGAPLARIELQAVFSRLIPRFPDMRPAVPVQELQPRDDLLTGGLTELPVTW